VTGRKTAIAASFCQKFIRMGGLCYLKLPGINCCWTLILHDDKIIKSQIFITKDAWEE
jgi:hypothetical protein